MSRTFNTPLNDYYIHFSHIVKGGHMIQIGMKKKYTILSENEELELTSNGDFVIKRALAENYEIIDFHCHSYECLFQLFPPFLQKRKSDFNKSLMDLSCFPFSIDLFDLNKIYFSKCCDSNTTHLTNVLLLLFGGFCMGLWKPRPPACPAGQ